MSDNERALAAITKFQGKTFSNQSLAKMYFVDMIEPHLDTFRQALFLSISVEKSQITNGER